MGANYPDDWANRSRRIKMFDNWKCQVCDRRGGRKGDAELHAHHVVPISSGGGHSYDNLTTLCDRCHAAYHNDPRLRAESDAKSTTFWGHVVVAILTIWWTFGLGNLLYAWGGSSGNDTISTKERKKRRKGIEGLRERAGKDATPTEPRGFWKEQVDTRYNDEFGGCPSCRERGLSVNWKQRDGGKAKVIECEHCRTEYTEVTTSEGTELERVDDSSSIESVDSALVYELEKQLETGEIAEDELADVKQRLLKEVASEQEKQLVRETFKQFE